MKSVKAEIVLEKIDALREFFSVALSAKSIAKNMLISGKDSFNLRLWAIRENMGINMKEFAKMCETDINEYKKYEFQGNKIPEDFIDKVCKKFNICKDWLKCKLPFFPLPFIYRNFAP